MYVYIYDISNMIWIYIYIFADTRMHIACVYQLHCVHDTNVRRHVYRQKQCGVLLRSFQNQEIGSWLLHYHAIGQVLGRLTWSQLDLMFFVDELVQLEKEFAGHVRPASQTVAPVAQRSSAMTCDCFAFFSHRSAMAPSPSVECLANELKSEMVQLLKFKEFQPAVDPSGGLESDVFFAKKLRGIHQASYGHIYWDIVMVHIYTYIYIYICTVSVWLNLI